MGRVTFENYGHRAAQNVSLLELAGRFSFQRSAQRDALGDIAAKLELCQEDNLLEIGCGAGNLLIPLSRSVRTVYGVDNPAVLARLRRRPGGRRVRCIPGNFLDISLRRSFSKILVYGVIHCLSSAPEVEQFIDKAAGLLRPGGIMLIGDIPNVDRKTRFLGSVAGRRFRRHWERLVRSVPASSPMSFPKDARSVRLDDRTLLGLVAHLRGAGLEAFLLPEPPTLCFAHTREDILVRKHS